jgi:hypothetical protein
LIAGTVVILFILGLFFEMLASRPKSDAEGQNDSQSEPTTTPAEPAPPVPAVHA